MSRPNQARIDLTALRHNLAHAKMLAPQSKIMAVVKANAYGHGAVTIAQALETVADALAVASIDEALELRKAGISAPILLLEGIFEASEIEIACTENFWICIGNDWQLTCLEQANLSKPLCIWLKIDTGMHRLGFESADVAKAYHRLMDCPNAQNKLVLCTHFAGADDLSSTQTQIQIDNFNHICESLPGERSAANSPGLLAWPNSHFEWVRPGYMLYGNSPLNIAHENTRALKPVMTLTSSIISLRTVNVGESVGYGASWTATRPSRIATITIGYGDGYPRLARNGTPVLINGTRAPLAGRVSMDMITVDVTDLDEVNLGDEVILWGQNLSISEIAECAGTIGYELTTRMPARTLRTVSNS